MSRPILTTLIALALAGCASQGNYYRYDTGGDYYTGASGPDVVLQSSPYYGGFGYSHGFGYGPGFGYGFGHGYGYGYGAYSPWGFRIPAHLLVAGLLRGQWRAPPESGRAGALRAQRTGLATDRCGATQHGT